MSAKKIKRISSSHGQRHNAFIMELGGQAGQSFADVLKPDLDALHELSKQFIGIDTPEIEMDRERDKTLHINHLENDDSTYGQSVSSQQKKYGTTFRMVAGKNDCDCEMDETSRALVAVATHGAVDVEKPL